MEKLFKIKIRKAQSCVELEDYGYEIPIEDLSPNEAEEYAEEIKQEFLRAYRDKRKSRMGGYCNEFKGNTSCG